MAFFLRRSDTYKKIYSHDRFIPSSSASRLDIAAWSMFTETKDPSYRPKNAYQALLRQSLFGNRTRIVEFSSSRRKNDDEQGKRWLHEGPSSVRTAGIFQERNLPQRPEAVRDISGFTDDYYLNLLDWSGQNILAVALDDAVYLWDCSTNSTAACLSTDDGTEVTSVSWSPDGMRLAVGSSNSVITLWDATTGSPLATMAGEHSHRVSSLAWKQHILTSGGGDGTLVNTDVRKQSGTVQTYKGHCGEICGLKWIDFGWKFASGGDDNLVHIWDMSMASHGKQWLHRLEDHKAAVRALAWCPSRSNLFATGGGTADQCIKFWNVNAGTCVKSVDTKSQVSSLIWNKKGTELLSSHGHPNNQLTLWKYPSMDKMGNFKAHTARVLTMAQSPNGCTVASAGADGSLMLWDVFGDPKLHKPPTKSSASQIPFSSFNQIR